MRTLVIGDALSSDLPIQGKEFGAHAGNKWTTPLLATLPHPKDSLELGTQKGGEGGGGTHPPCSYQTTPAMHQDVLVCHCLPVLQVALMRQAPPGI